MVRLKRLTVAVQSMMVDIVMERAKARPEMDGFLEEESESESVIDISSDNPSDCIEIASDSDIAF